MKVRFQLLIIIIAALAYFVTMHYSNTITIEGLQQTYNQGDEIRFIAVVQGFGDGVSSYTIDFQRTDEVGRLGLSGLSSAGDNLSYLNFPMPFKESIEHSVDTTQQLAESGTYIMRFSAVGHTIEKSFTILP